MTFFGTDYFLTCVRVASRSDEILHALVVDGPRPEREVYLLAQFRTLSRIPMPIALRGMIDDYNRARFRRTQALLFGEISPELFRSPHYYPGDMIPIIHLAYGLLDLVNVNEA
ncbi:hypothetical protein KQX54_006895 [Cotesia glomerata]|uniref:Uncharacterized protein n=1 Tax=Cotesia glomerata TaxID=32391 RepID=A0AAV7ITK8_COTGL|nr:hypothetical protein KQX54_006895 [Cotesia glomerata]